ncbi:type II toxin-antitoxin system RelB/DinJ family antitoxin [Pseudosulfitobacter sp. DSM 107133]|uniref:type II toxin-antitoxin system RelB/DinJ family antitoxin n=1 Tax=Pseudosulfitobacter sp. DSM 107133 TaxID=2883100 RepID=UPI000DF1ADCF|nr:type II toxin-antitoxin system RelB/DinJ family antitoxin [Pseudosulfitobacter sp. DSM 107133]UOA30258.1 Antitoxin DinJ [Pseudosulfitobacter sp. DSM 107133]
MPATATQNAFVRTRINNTLRDEAAAVLSDLGLTVSDVMRMTLTRIAKEKAIPFELVVPNAETRAAIDEARELQATRAARFTTSQELFDGLEKESGC